MSPPPPPFQSPARKPRGPKIQLVCGGEEQNGAAFIPAVTMLVESIQLRHSILNNVVYSVLTQNQYTVNNTSFCYIFRFSNTSYGQYLLYENTFNAYIHYWTPQCLHEINKFKSVPLQAWSGPEGSRKLRFRDYLTKAQEGGKLSAHRPSLPTRNTPGTHFC